MEQEKFKQAWLEKHFWNYEGNDLENMEEAFQEAFNAGLERILRPMPLRVIQKLRTALSPLRDK
jgi:hypothetical protein